MELYTIAPSSLQFSTRITPDQDETVHRHDYFEIFIVLQGHITHITPFGRVTLQTGDGYLIAPDAPHNFKRLREPCTHRDFMITPTLMKQACDFVEQGLYERLIKTRYLPLQVDRIEPFSANGSNSKRCAGQRLFSFCKRKCTPHAHIQAQDLRIRCGPLNTTPLRCSRQLSIVFPAAFHHGKLDGMLLESSEKPTARMSGAHLPDSPNGPADTSALGSAQAPWALPRPVR